MVVELIPENTKYKVDASGRIIIPSYLRAKFEIEVGDQLEYFTAKDTNGMNYVCVRKIQKGE